MSSDGSLSGANTNSTLSLSDDRDAARATKQTEPSQLANRHKLVLINECQREILKLYKIAALVEIVFFLAFIGFYLSHTLQEASVYSFWQIGTTLRSMLMNGQKAQDVLRSQRSLDTGSVVRELLTSSLNLSVLHDKSRDFMTKNLVVCNSIRLRHQKVKESNCKSTNFDAMFPFESEMLPCAPPYSSNDEFTSPMPINGWLYSDHLRKRVVYADGLTTYGNGGFQRLLSLDSESVNLSRALHGVLDARLRLVSVELLIFNKELAVLTDLGLFLTVNPSGLVQFSDRVFSAVIHSSDHFMLVFFMTAFYLVYYGYEKANELLNGDLLVSTNFLMHLFDSLAIYTAVLTCLYSARLLRLLMVHDYRQEAGSSHASGGSNLVNMITKCSSADANSTTDHYEEINKYLDDYYYFHYASVTFATVAMSRLFKLAIIYRPLEIIIKSICSIFYNIFKFSLFFLVIFFAFALFGVTVFGKSMREYQTFSDSCWTLVAFIFGELNYDKYYEYDETIGTVYFCSFIVAIILLGFNILSVVIAESFFTVKSYLYSDSQRHHIKPSALYVQRNFNYLIDFKLSRYEYEVKVALEEMVLQRTSHRILTKIEVDRDFSRLGYDSATLNEMLKKHGFLKKINLAAEQLESSARLHRHVKKIRWKKIEIDDFVQKIGKERKELEDLFHVFMERKEREMEDKYLRSLQRELFVNKERLFILEEKVLKLKNVARVIGFKAQEIKAYLCQTQSRSEANKQ